MDVFVGIAGGLIGGFLLKVARGCGGLWAALF